MTTENSNAPLFTHTVKVGTTIVPFHAIVSVDASRVEDLHLVLHLSNGTVLNAYDIDAIELIMQLKPVIAEGHRLRWPKFMWMVHNLIGHPVMQILALLGLHTWAFRVHDATVPRPLGRKKRSKKASP